MKIFFSNRLYICVASLMFSCCSLVFSKDMMEGDIALEIIISQNQVFVYVENKQRQELKLLGNLEIGGKVSLSPLFLTLRDIQGNLINVQGVIDTRFKREAITLPSSHIYGRKFSFNAFKLYFNIKPGVYEIKATYHDKSADKINKRLSYLESGWVKVKME